MKVRFLADADLNRAIVTGVQRREPSVDFQTAQSAGLRRVKDPQVLALAAEGQRILVSHDVGHNARSLPHIQGRRKLLSGRLPGYSSWLLKLVTQRLESEPQPFEWDNQPVWLPCLHAEQADYQSAAG